MTSEGLGNLDNGDIAISPNSEEGMLFSDSSSGQSAWTESGRGEGSPSIRSTGYSSPSKCASRGRIDLRIRHYSGDAGTDLTGWIIRYETAAQGQAWTEREMKDRLAIFLTGEASNWCYGRKSYPATRSLQVDPERADKLWSDLTWTEVKEELLEAFLPADFETHLREKLYDQQAAKESVITFFHAKRHICRQLRMSSPETVRVVRRTVRPEYRKLLGTEVIDRSRDLLRHLKAADLSLSDDRKAHDANREIARLRQELAKLRGQPPDRGVISKSVCYNCGIAGHRARECRRQGASRKDGKRFNSRMNPDQRRFRSWNKGKASDETSIKRIIPTGERGDASNKERINKVDLKPYSSIVCVVKINEIPIKGIVDTGAAICCLDADLAKEVLGKEYPKLQASIGLVSAGGAELATEGVIRIEVQFTVMKEHRVLETDLVLVQQLGSPLLLGRNFIAESGCIINPKTMSRELSNCAPGGVPETEASNEPTQMAESNVGIIHEVTEPGALSQEEVENWFEHRLEKVGSSVFFDKAIDLQLIGGKVKIGADIKLEEQDDLRQVLDSFSDMFAFQGNIGDCSITTHQIDLLEEKPISSAPYRLSYSTREIVAKQVRDWIEMGVVRHSRSPWASPVVVVPKKDGSSRICVDYRRLNKVTRRDAYPLPNLEDLFTCLNGSTMFSSIDLNQGYLQVRMNPESIAKTAFITQDGLFEFTRMPFGLTNAPATFQRVMDSTLSGLKWNKCLVYLDDVVIVGKDIHEHNKNLKLVLGRLKEAGLTIKPVKCAFAMSALKFLGHIVDKEGVRVDHEKVAAISEIPAPTTVTEIRSFIGAASYYRRFIEKFAVIAEPMTRLTKANVPFIWGIEQQSAFNQLKEKLSTEPVLCHYNPKTPIELRTDACKTGLGAILLHIMNDGSKKVIAYASRQLLKREQNYHVSEQECLAIVWAINKFRTYLQGIKFKVITDHAALTWLQEKQNPAPRLLRWTLELQPYNFEVEYKSGRMHQDADLLSRNALPINVIRYGRRGQAPKRDNRITSEERSFTPRDIQVCSLASLREAQVTDPDCIKIKGTVNDSSRFIIEEGLLKEVSQEPEFTPNRIVVPLKLMNDVLYTCHDDPFCAHCGYRKTLWRFRKKYYIRHEARLVKNYVMSCHLCQTRKDPYTRKVGFLQPLQLARRPFERIGIDTLGPFRKSQTGMTKIIVVTDYFTKWAIAKAVSRETGSEIANMLNTDVICKYGAPDTILSDRGKIFQTEIMRELYNMWTIKHLRTSAYHPQTNGLTERANRTLAVMLSMYVNSKHNDWDQYLPYVVFAYNTVIQDSTGFSPFTLLYGYEARSPTDVEGHSSTESENHRYEKLQEARDLALRANEASRDTQKSQYDKRHRKPPEFRMRDKVLVYRPRGYIGQTSKLRHAWEGPFEVISKSSPLLYLVKRMRSVPRKPREEWVNVQRMKLYYTREELCQ